MLLVTTQKVSPNSSDPYCCFLVRMNRFPVITGKDNDTYLAGFMHYTWLYHMFTASWWIGGKDSSFPTPQELTKNLFVYNFSNVCAIGVEPGIGTLAFFSSLLKPLTLQIGYTSQRQQLIALFLLSKLEISQGKMDKVI